MINLEIREIMSKLFSIEIETISNNATQKEISNWDSLQHLNLIVDIEDKYNISIDPEDISTMISIDKIVEIINKYKNV